MLLTATKRPRNVNAARAAGILYGDWGTSKAYVIGLAFALAGFASFWLIAAVSVLSLLIGLNYIVICRYYPNGGGVYASVRRRSQVISILGAFFLIADFLVTAALSALSAFSYIQIGDPVLWSIVAIFVVGLLNYFGPRHTGNLAIVIVMITLVALVLLACFSIPQFPEAWRQVEPLQGGVLVNWMRFVGVIVALSGVESIANTTGVMTLDPDSSEEYPQVTRTSTPAILWVMAEVVLFTTLFGFAMMALHHLTLVDGNVNAPGNPGVRDYMLKYMGETFASALFGAKIGWAFGLFVSLAIGILLLSAVNTAMIGLISLNYVMANDGEIPSLFRRLNRYGVPIVPLLFATGVPILLLLLVGDMVGLADLYAIGFCGAIATNLGSTSTDLSLPLKLRERILMFFSFLIMLAIELTLFIEKPKARHYALALIVVGLILRALTKERREKEALPLPATPSSHALEASGPPILCFARKPNNAVRHAIKSAIKKESPLYLLFVREQRVLAEPDLVRHWEQDEEAVRLFAYAREKLPDHQLRCHYVVSDALVETLREYSQKLKVTQLVMGLPKKHTVFDFLRGSIVRDIMKRLPKDVQLMVIP